MTITSTAAASAASSVRLPSFPSPPDPQAPPPSIYALGVALQSLSSQIHAASQLLSSSDPELVADGTVLLEQYLAAEDSTKTALAAKAVRLLLYCDHLIAQAAFRKEHSRRLAELAKRDETAVSRLHSTLVTVLTSLHPEDKRFRFPTHELSSRRSELIEIDPALDPEADLPPELLRIKTTVEPDKSAIKAAIKAGRSVPGCQLLQRRSWTVH